MSSKVTYIHLASSGAGELLAEHLLHQINLGRKVLWFISGGSSIPIARNALQILGAQPAHMLRILIVDEKFTDKDQPVTNWLQVTQDSDELRKLVPRILRKGQSVDDSTRLFQEIVKESMEWADFSIGQFGIGEGFHTGGIESHSKAVSDDQLVVYYQRGEFQHITVTTKLISLLDQVFVNSFGEGKRELVEHFSKSNVSIRDEPTQALKTARKLVVVTDIDVAH